MQTKNKAILINNIFSDGNSLQYPVDIFLQLI